MSESESESDVGAREGLAEGEKARLLSPRAKGLTFLHQSHCRASEASSVT
jgi:hypothetical protein